MVFCGETARDSGQAAKLRRPGMMVVVPGKSGAL